MKHRVVKNTIHINSITYLEIAQLGISVFVLYVFWFLGAHHESRLLLYGSIGLSTFVTIADMRNSNYNLNIGIYSIIPLLVSYLIYSFASGLFAHQDWAKQLQSIFTLFSFTIVCYDVCYISKRKNSIDWIYRLFILAALVCSIQTIFAGISVRSAGVMVKTMGVDNNPNGLALVMLLGIFSILKSLKGNKNLLIYGSLSLVFLYVILLTGSRKILISGILLFGLWAVVSLLDKNVGVSKIRKLVLIVVVCIALGTIYYYYTNYFTTTAAYERFVRLEMGDSINGRTRLYNYAFKLFIDNPFFGVGYDQYRLIVGEMSHSTYAEILACSGFFGVLLWLLYIFSFLKNQIRMVRMVKGTSYSFEFAMFVGMLLIEAVLGLGQVWFYDITHLLLLTAITCSLYFTTKEVKQYREGYSSEKNN